MTLTRLRAVVLVLCACGIAGMIVSTIATDNNLGWVMSFGLLAALSMTALIIASTVRPSVTAQHEALAEQIEAGVNALVASGASEAEVRKLVGDAVRFGRVRGEPETTK
jgi:L-lactate utilization protein LutC